ncbi:hypothetical protein PUN28_001289 [Cardiocondyla obscurior]|uniref:MOSC domain-containing protein n=1 Tax=Cardiocondyla obscurior TaxID=286306 RepID=A0AAW2H4S8_9HYME
MNKARLTYATTVAIGVGTAVFVIWWWWNRKQGPKPPSKWRKVGELSDMVMYPVKSLGPVRKTEMECTTLGLKSGWLRDRTLLVIDLEGRFLTARQQPKMVNVSPSVSGSVLTLSAPGMMSVSVDLAQLRGKSFRVAVWGQAVPARDCGEEPARWLSRYILQEDVGLRLVYYPLDRPVRPVRQKNVKSFPKQEPIDAGAYPDETSYTLANEASIADLNTRLDEPVVAQQFRMSFLVKGPSAYEEDNWDWVKIGNVIMRNLRPCTRCIFTTINPETGTKHPNTEPLKTLRSYRQITDPQIRPAVGDSPAMGIHLGLRGPNGVVRLGDPVYVGIPEEKPPPVTSPS